MENFKALLMFNLHQRVYTLRFFLQFSGTEEQWRVCVSDTNNNMGFAVGSMFVRSAFHSDAKPMAQDMIENIRIAFQDNFRNLGWMDDETRQLAKEKAVIKIDKEY